MAQASKEELKHTRKKAERSCTICSNHGIRSMLKGHKRHCPFLNCHCVLCVKGRKKRGVMKKQVRLRRKQMKAIENHRTPCLSTAVEPIQGTRLSLCCLSFYSVTFFSLVKNQTLSSVSLCLAEVVVESRFLSLVFFQRNRSLTETDVIQTCMENIYVLCSRIFATF